MDEGEGKATIGKTMALGRSVPLFPIDALLTGVRRAYSVSRLRLVSPSCRQSPAARVPFP